jgi:autotransporter passenger strand-loop-strand repeat protein
MSHPAGWPVAAGSAPAVSSGGVASATLITSGYQNVFSGGSSFGTILRGASTFETVYGTASGTTVSSGGYMALEYGGVASNTHISGGMLEQVGGVLTGGLTFAGSGGTFQIDTLVPPTVAISGFAAGDQIFMTDRSYNSAETVSVTSANVVTITSGG